jgi:DNA mismatch endonuclease (patch repair protein)
MHALGLRYRKDLPVVLDGLRVRPDFVFSRVRVAVLLDGCFWHKCPEHFQMPRANREYWEPKLARNVERDRRADAALAAAGWRVIRIWEHEVLADPEAAADRVCAALAHARNR